MKRFIKYLFLIAFGIFFNSQINAHSINSPNKKNTKRDFRVSNKQLKNNLSSKFDSLNNFTTTSFTVKINKLAHSNFNTYLAQNTSLKTLKYLLKYNSNFWKYETPKGLAVFYTIHKVLAEAGSKLTKRLTDLKLSKLTTKLDELGDGLKTKFLDDFVDASDDALKAFNKNVELLDSWKTKNPKYKSLYTAPNDIEINDVLKSVDNSIDRKLIKQVQDIDVNELGSSFCVSGGTHPNLLDMNEIVKYNLPKMDGFKNVSKYNK